MFACGNNDHGQLGLGHDRRVALPVDVPALTDMAGRHPALQVRRHLLGRAGPGRAGPGRAGPGRFAGPLDRAGSGRADWPGRAGLLGRAGPVR